MELDKFINALNQKKSLSNLTVDNLEDTDLTEAEKAFITTYRPEQALIIYGSLAPDGPNHSVVQHISGQWEKGFVRGKLANKGWGADLGYYGFTHARPEEQETIKAYVLFSDELVANWPLLDEFEGSGYRRLLAQYELENGETGVGNIYAID